MSKKRSAKSMFLKRLLLNHNDENRAKKICNVNVHIERTDYNNIEKQVALDVPFEPAVVTPIEAPIDVCCISFTFKLKMSSWDVVVWEKGDSCDYLPSSWKVGNTNMYLWPKLPNSKIVKMIDLCEKPNHLYSYEEAVATCKATVTDVGSAKALVEKLQFTSNLSSDDGVNVCSPIESNLEDLKVSLNDSLLKCTDCCKMASEFPKLLKSVGATQFDVKEIKKILRDIQNDMKALTETSMENKNTNLKLKFPLETEEELTTFEEDLKNQDIYNEAVKIMSLIGGNNLKKNVHGILKRLLNKELSLKYSALGRKGKRNFSKLLSFKMVTDAVRTMYPNATESEILSDISTCLATSGDRDGGRQKREINKENK